jgi:hypothetical protein
LPLGQASRLLPQEELVELIDRLGNGGHGGHRGRYGASALPRAGNRGQAPRTLTASVHPEPMMALWGQQRFVAEMVRTVKANVEAVDGPHTFLKKRPRNWLSSWGHYR